MDAKKISHYQRLDKFIAECLANDIYPEVPSEPHLSITRQMIDKLGGLKNLVDAKVLDAGCGQGLALEIFREKGAQPIGTTFGEDYRICRERGFEVHEMDQSFLEFEPNTFDVIWCRHAIEHSLFPLFTLRGFYEVLKSDGILYIEVPAPTTSARHETNPNHYSCFTAPVLASLFEKAKFRVSESLDINFTPPCGPDTYHAFFLGKQV
jgi:SAM-dependent methyltransferase